MLISAFLVEDKPAPRQTLIETIDEIAPVKFVGLSDSEADATQWLHAHPGGWDLAIVDLFLAQGTDFGVLIECQTRKLAQKVVVLTSYTQRDLLRRCRELGADEVFDKAQDVDKLVSFCKAHATTLSSRFSPTH